MKKLAVSALALALILSFACFANAETFRVGIDAEYPPYTYLNDDGEYDGFDVAMAKLVCEINGWDIEIVPIGNWDFRLQGLDAGEYDAIWSGMTITDEMVEQGYALSFCYYDNTQVVLTKKGSGIETLADLSGKLVAVQLGTSADILLSDPEGQLDLAATFQNGEPLRLENYNVCFLELQAGSVDALVIDMPVAQTKIRQYGDDYYILSEDLGAEDYGICFRKGEDELCKKVEDAYMQLVKNGRYAYLAGVYEIGFDSLTLLGAE